MNIVKKEILEFSEKESDALHLVIEMCSGIKREATNPELLKLADEISYKLCVLWWYKE
jgi:hypothetical protein